MSEFNNRIAAQREVVKSINGCCWKEELFGLSSGAIDRWIAENDVDPSSVLVKLIREVADKLFFLSNKSQEQVTDDYKLLSNEVARLTDRIRSAVIESH